MKTSSPRRPGRNMAGSNGLRRERSQRLRKGFVLATPTFPTPIPKRASRHNACARALFLRLDRGLVEVVGRDDRHNACARALFLRRCRDSVRLPSNQLVTTPAQGLCSCDTRLPENCFAAGSVTTPAQGLCSCDVCGASPSSSPPLRLRVSARFLSSSIAPRRRRRGRILVNRTRRPAGSGFGPVLPVRSRRARRLFVGPV